MLKNIHDADEIICDGYLAVEKKATENKNLMKSRTSEIGGLTNRIPLRFDDRFSINISEKPVKCERD